MLQTANQIIESQNALISKFGKENYEKAIAKIDNVISRVASDLKVTKTDAAAAMLKVAHKENNNIHILVIISWFGNEN